MTPGEADRSPDTQPAAPAHLREAMARSLELTTDTVLVTDDTGTILWANPWGLEVFGRSLSDVVGRSYLEFVHPDDVADALAVFARSGDPRRARGIRTARYRARHADGSYIPLWFNGANVLGTGVMVIHGRRPVDAEILEEITEEIIVGAPFEEVLALVPMLGSWRFDRSLHAVFYRTEDGQSAMTGDGELAVLGSLDDPTSPIARLARGPSEGHSGPLDDHPDQIARPLADVGVTFLASRCVVDPFDERRCVAVSALFSNEEAMITKTVLLRMTRAIHLVLQARDRVVRLRRTADDLQRFLTDVSHELRTPLTAMVGFADLYAAGVYSTRDEERRAIERIRSEGSRMMGMVEDLLLLARLDEGRSSNRNPVDLATLVREVATDAEAAYQDRHIGVGTSETTVVDGDADQLRQVFDNLVGNACRHTPAGSPVELAVERVGVEAVVMVSDQGPGIAPEIREHMFERFYSAAPESDRQASAGLGLSIVQAIVSAHGGRVSVESSPGDGTRFSVHLPLLEPRTAGAAGLRHDDL